MVLWFVCAFPVYAQVWSLDVSGADTFATLDVAELDEAMDLGESFELQVDANAVYSIKLNELTVAVNGDRSWYGSITDTGLDYALVITVGNKTAHLILTSPSGIFQLFGVHNGNGLYRGQFNRLEHVRDAVATTDDIIVPQNAQNKSIITTGLCETSSGDFVIEQTVSQSVAPVGSTLTFELDILNCTGLAQSDLYADIHFVLENTSLENMPENCQVLPSTDQKPVLSCALDDFAAGQVKQLSYTVSTNDTSHPLVESTARVTNVRGELVSDNSAEIVELYRDLLTDSDGDGISDYNEALIGLDPQNALDAVNERTANIDVLVAYTSDIQERYLGEVDTRINQLFNVANKIFADSDTGIQIRPVGIHEVGYTAAENLFDDLSTVTYQSDDTLADLERRRNLYGGDLVVLFRTGETNGLCGLANLGGKGTQGDLSGFYHRNFAYSVINIDCMDDSVLAHEVGHNLGLVHSRREDAEGGTLPYSAGFGIDESFVTVMAFPDDFDVVNRLYRFSDPERDCGPFGCGADKSNETEGADAVGSLKQVKHQVSAYMPSQEARIKSVKTISSVSGPSKSVVGLSAYTEGSTDFANTFSADSKLKIRMKITPLPRHVGQAFVTHLVVMAGSSLYQVSGDGSLEKWNGSLNTLRAMKKSRVMGNRMVIDIVEELDLQAVGLSNSKLSFFSAYSMYDGELVYGISPFSITLNK